MDAESGSDDALRCGSGVVVVDGARSCSVGFAAAVRSHAVFRRTRSLRSMTEPQRDMTRTLLGAIFLGALIVASFCILRPFLGAAVWATTIVVATWPVLLWLQGRLWRRRMLAVVAMILILL